MCLGHMASPLRLRLNMVMGDVTGPFEGLFTIPTTRLSVNDRKNAKGLPSFIYVTLG